MIRDWLKTYKGGIYESYSVCEVILVDDLFADMRDCVSWAGAFISHAGKSHMKSQDLQSNHDESVSQ